MIRFNDRKENFAFRLIPFPTFSVRINSVQLITAFFGLLVCQILTASSLHAQLTPYTDRTTFEAAAGTTIVETFDSFATEDAFHTNAVDAGDFTISADAPINGSYNFIDRSQNGFQDTWADVNGTTAMNVFLNKNRKLIFTFDTAITAFGADFRDINELQSRVDFLINGESVTPSVYGDDTTNFFGIISDTEFTVLEIDAAYGQNDNFGVDNVTYSMASVPEPKSIALLSIAAGSFGILYYRRRKLNAQDGESSDEVKATE